MRALDLDYVRRRAARPAWPAWLLLAVGAVLLGDALLDTMRLRDEVDQWQQRRDSSSVPAAVVKEVIDEPTRREIEVARKAFDELALPWEPLFRSIEHSLGEDTALLAIEPDAGKRALRISGEARSYPAVLAFMVRLEESQVLGDVHLISHELREDTAERPVQFMLVALWRANP